MNEYGMNLMKLINMNPTFKGSAVILVGLLSLFFAWWMKERWHEPFSFGFKVFVGLAAFIVLYGAYIVVFQPAWWQLPY